MRSRLSKFGFPTYDLTFTVTGAQIVGETIEGNPRFAAIPHRYRIYLIPDSKPRDVTLAGMNEYDIALRGRVVTNLNANSSELRLHDSIGHSATAPMTYLGSDGEFVLTGKTYNQTARIRRQAGERVIGFWRARG